MARAYASIPLAVFLVLTVAVAAQNCQPGFFRTTDPATSAPICAPCPPDTFSDAVDATACRPCSPNSVPSEAQDTCFCLPGFFFDISIQACTMCPEGTFLPTLNTNFATSCISCTANSAPNTQRTTCFCNEGFFFNELQGCSPCPAGTFRSGANINFATSCTPCPDNTFQPIPGSSRCIQCVGGTVSNAERTICLPGVVTPPTPPTFPPSATANIPNIPNFPGFTIPQGLPIPPELLQ